MSVLQEYLPQALTADEVDAIIAKAITETSAAGIKDMSKVMAAVKPQVIGRADMGQISGLIKAKLG